MVFLSGRLRKLLLKVVEGKLSRVPERRFIRLSLIININVILMRRLGLFRVPVLSSILKLGSTRIPGKRS
jgi:hypothetical protein